MVLGSADRKLGKFFSVMRIALIVYEFTRLLLSYPDGNYLNFINGFFALGGILSVAADIKKDPSILKTPQAFFSVIILFVVVFSTYCSVGTIHWILPEWLLQVSWLTLFLHLSISLYTEEDLHHELKTVNFIILILTFLGTALSLVGYLFSSEGINLFQSLPVDTNYVIDGRFEGMYRWPTIAGIINLIAMIECTMHFRNSKKGFRFFLVIDFVIQMVSLYLSRSRAPMIALIAVLLVCVVYSLKNTSNKKVGFILIAVLIAGVGVTAGVFLQRRGAIEAASKAYDAYLSSLPDQNAIYAMSPFEYQLDLISSYRIRTWKTAIAATSSMPFLVRGWGIANFNDIVSWVFPGLSQNFPDQMHNMFVQSFLDAGLLGLISLVSLIILNIRCGIKVIQKNRSDEFFGMFLIMIAIGVFCCFDLGIWFRKWFYSGIFWLFGGYFWWLARYQARKADK